MNTSRLAFQIGKIGHVAPDVADVGRASRFHQDILGFFVSDTYQDDMMPGGAAFVRCSPDHHDVALFSATEPKPPGAGLRHLALLKPSRQPA